MDRRVISRGGRHYVVLYRQGAAQFRYELCRRKPGATSLKAAAVQTRDVVAGRAAAQIARGPEDRLVVAGRLDAPPSAAWVVDDEPYVVLLRKRIRREEREPALRLLGSKGVVWTRTLKQLFGEPAGQFGRVRRGGWHWFQAAWLTADERGVCVLGKRDQLVRVELATGKVGRADLLDGFDAATGDARLDVLDAAARLRPKGLREAALKLAARAKEPLAVRIRAAYSALIEGEATPWRKLSAAALAHKNVELRAYALARLPDAIGEKAVEHWRKALRQVAGMFEVVRDVDRARAARARARIENAITDGCRRLDPEVVRRIASDGDPVLRAAARRALPE